MEADEKRFRLIIVVLVLIAFLSATTFVMLMTMNKQASEVAYDEEGRAFIGPDTQQEVIKLSVQEGYFDDIEKSRGKEFRGRGDFTADEFDEIDRILNQIQPFFEMIEREEFEVAYKSVGSELDQYSFDAFWSSNWAPDIYTKMIWYEQEDDITTALVEVYSGHVGDGDATSHDYGLSLLLEFVIDDTSGESIISYTVY